MSMEQAILKLAEAMMAQAEAIKDSAAAQREANEGYKASIVAYATAAGGAVAAEDKAAVKKNVQAEPDRAEPAAQKTKDQVAPSDELGKAVTQVEEAAKETPVDDGLTELSYTADVRPVLLKLNKAKGSDALKALLAKYKVKNGDQLTAPQFAPILADANAQLAA